jgi:hypothetical protein
VLLVVMVFGRGVLCAMLLPLHPPGLLLLLCCCLSMLMQHWHALRQLTVVLMLLQTLPRSQVCRHGLLLLMLHGQHTGIAKSHLAALSWILRLVLTSLRRLCTQGSRVASVALAVLLCPTSHGAATCSLVNYQLPAAHAQKHHHPSHRLQLMGQQG